MTLRRRLLLAAVVITATVIAALGYVAIRQREVLTAQIDDQIRTVAANIARDGSDPELGQTPVTAEDGSPLTGELFVSIVGPDGTVQAVARPVSRPDLVLDIAVAELPERAAVSDPFTVDVSAGNGAARAIVVNIGVNRVAVVALSTDAVDDAQYQLLTTAAVALAVILTTMAAALWSMDRLGLRPITEVTRAAEAVAGGRSERRVTLPALSTEAGRLGEAFNTMLDARQVAEDRQRRFVADASHELRTPLTTLQGYTALHAGGGLTADGTKDAMRRISSEAKRMEGLVDGLLTLASYDDDRPLDLTTLDLSQLLVDIAADAHAVQPDRPIDTTAVRHGVTVEADRHELTQALTTIVTNALRHTPINAQLLLAAHRCGDNVHVVIEDRGPGIASEHLERLFERFYRVDDGRARSSGGSGLGLPIARAIIESHGGGIDAESEPAVGTTITIDLPTKPRA